MSESTQKKSRARVLVVDDEASARSGLQKLLEQEGYVVDVAEDGEVALARFSETAADVVITDLKMPKMEGMELLKRLREQDQSVPVSRMHFLPARSAPPSRAMRAGAEDYPHQAGWISIALTVAIERALERRELRMEDGRTCGRQIRDRDGAGLEGLVGTSPAMQKVYRVARQVACGAGDGSAHQRERAARAKGSSLAPSTRSDRGAERPPSSLSICAALAETLPGE